MATDALNLSTNRHRKAVLISWRTAGVCGSGTVMSLVLAPLAPQVWTWLAYAMLLCVPGAMIAAGAALFYGWRPALPAMPKAPVGYRQRVRMYTSEQLRGAKA